MELVDIMPQTGKVEWIGIRPGKRADLIPLEKVEANTNNGLSGDHYAGTSGKRQVTLIQAEHFHLLEKVLKKEKIHPEMLRRNIVVSGINLLALEKKQFKIGEVILEMTGRCPPCSRMEENLGPGGYNAMRSHGGITASVIQAGEIRLGDSVNMLK